MLSDSSSGNQEFAGRVDALFSELSALPPERQQARLAEVAVGDLELAAEVGSLLNAFSSRDRILDRTPADLAASLLDSPLNPDAFTPAAIGPYRILRPLGHGGMGSVYLATREDLGGKVALKLLRDSWGPTSRWERFIAEQRTLASFNHPNIAHIMDSGIHEGTPWFAMEYVAGSSITSYCARHQTPLSERLSLFRSVCQAVAYAHSRLVVHLDLKPSNILVNEISGEVKLVDFGISKHVSEAGVTTATTAPFRMMSLNYAAPEQWQGDTVGTETDVFALGVVLYELLAGRLPAELSGYAPGQLVDWAKLAPARPSLSEPRAVAASRSQWADLDVLCLKALHRDRTRRYTDAAALQRDVTRFLHHHPLEARPDTLVYRASKFIQRHRAATLTAAIAAAALLAVAIAFNHQLIRARDRALAAQARAERIQQLMANLFQGDDSAAGPSESLRVVSLLDRGARETEALNDQPELRAAMESTLGDLYAKLGYSDRAVALLQASLDRRRKLFGGGHPVVIQSALALATVKTLRGDNAEALALAGRAEGLARDLKPFDEALHAQALAVLGKVRSAEGSYREALTLLERAAALSERQPRREQYSETLGDLSNTLYYLGRLDESEKVNRRGLALDRAVFGPGHPHVAIDLFNLGNIRLDRGDYAEAMELYKQSLGITSQWYGPQHPKNGSKCTMLGRTLQYLGRFQEADAFYARAQAIFGAPGVSEPLRAAQVLSLRGTLATERRDFAVAEQYLTRAAEAFEKVVGQGHEFYLVQLSHLGALAVARGDAQGGLALLGPLEQKLSAVVGSNNRYTLMTRIRLGQSLALAGRVAEAEKLLRSALEALTAESAGHTAEAESARRALAALPRLR